MKNIFLLLLVAAAPARAAPLSMEGLWEVTWSCEQGAVCPAGEDSFHLDVRAHGGQLCAKFLASAHGGNKVDEDEDGEPPSVVGRYGGDAATVAYTSHWGGHGVASIRVDGDALIWNVLWHDAGESYVPSGAVLHQVSREGRPLWRDFTCPEQDAERGLRRDR